MSSDRFVALISATGLAIVSPVAVAQSEVLPPVEQSGQATDPSDAAPITVPALTPVYIEVLADLSSKTSTSGDTFPFRLAEPVMIDGREVIPAGTTGMGEVVHAKKAGGSGSPGELVLAARYLELGGVQHRLRSLRHAANAGHDSYGRANTIAIVSAVALPVAAFAGFLVKGSEIEWPKGSLAEAKTAEAFVVDNPPAVEQAAKSETGEAK